MSVTYGFYNSLNGDRKYDTSQISDMFNGVLNDGIFPTIGTALMVTAGSGMTVNIGIGKGWFNSTWLNNDAILPKVVDESEVLLDRKDAYVLEFNSTLDVRANSIKYIKGTPSSSPVVPTMINTTSVHQYPLCYVTVKKGVTEITTADIENRVGTSDCPFVGLVDGSINVDALIAQWQAQWNAWVQATQNTHDTWETNEQTDFTTWFNNMKGQLTTDAAGNLQNEIDIINSLKGQANGFATLDANGKLVQTSGLAKMSTPISKTLTAAGWTGSAAPYSQDVTIVEVTATNYYEIIPDPSATKDQRAMLQAANFGHGSQSAGHAIILADGDKPTADLPVVFIIRGDL